jgi:hypothetical protein
MELSAKFTKKRLQTFLSVALMLVLCITFVKVQASVLDGVLPSVGCITDGNAEAYKTMTTTGNGTYFHTYGAPVFTWSEDGSSCTVAFKCSYEDDTLNADCSIASTPKKAAATDKDGSRTCTASVTVYGVTYTDTKTFAVKAPAKISLAASAYVYDGKSKKPAVTVKDSEGKKISSSNYTVTYSDNKKVGTASVTVTFDGKQYQGTLTKTFKIKPVATSLKKVTAKKTGFQATWVKKTAQITGYQIRYSTSSKFTAASTKSVKVEKNSTTSTKVTGLKSGKKYYVQIRTYKTVDGTNYYSEWSEASTVTTK